MVIIISNIVTDRIQGFLNKTIVCDNLDKERKHSYEHCIKADALRIRNYFLESISEYLLAISYDENNKDAFKGLGLSYKQLGKMQNAIIAFEKAVKQMPFDKNLRYELASCYYQNNNLKQALIEFKRVIKLDPDFVDAQNNLALVHELVGETDMAIKIYNKIIETNSEYLSAYNNLGSLYLKLENFAMALRIFRQAIKINKEFSRAYLGIAITFDRMFCPSDAVRYYKKYLRIKPNSANVSYIVQRMKELKIEKKGCKQHSPKLKLVAN
jgi:tetratricopeptide (TPR) repeat protein